MLETAPPTNSVHAIEILDRVPKHMIFLAELIETSQILLGFQGAL
jgi:hypothetical protein